MSKAEGFAAVPNWMIRDESVTLYAVSVYAALASHSGPGGIHPSQSTLAREARCSERKVRDALVELVALGVVSRVRRKNSRGRAPSGYALHPNGQLLADEEAEEVAAHGAGTSEVPAPQDEVAAHGAGGSGTSVQPVPLIEEEPFKKNPIEEGPRKRGTRIPEPFMLTAEMRAWAASEVPGLDIDAHTREFVDHWRAESGVKATKLDWVGTWRNWMRKAFRWSKPSQQRPQPMDRLQETFEVGQRVQAALDAQQVLV